MIMSMLIFSILLLHPLCHAAIFDIVNQCPYTIWPAAIPGGGRQLSPGQNWTIFVNPRMDDARIWARTGCTFNDSGHGQCDTGDCNGLLECQTYGSPPNTLAQFTLNGFNNLDFFQISLVDGFNVPMDFSPTAGCSNRGINCSADITGQCPDELKATGGCNNPCQVFKTDEYCCNSGKFCKPTTYSNFFKGLCPDAFTYPMDDETSTTFTCVGGTDYTIVFCPSTIFSTAPSPTPPSLPSTGTFDIVNKCSYTVWAAAFPGGGRQLNKGETWNINVNPGTTGGRIWARTYCNFDSSGHGSCQTGDCNGLLQCQAYGNPPNTLAEFSLNQYNNLDFIDISLVDGFNVPMDFSPTGGCARGIRCSADITGQCPAQLKAPGGCNNPCTVFKTDEYCCNSGSCSATDYSKFFKRLCPDAYSYPKDDQTSTFTCPGGTKYRVVFCPD